MFKIGITGTRSGMNSSQKEEFKTLLSDYVNMHKSVEFHHGDCIGVDVEAAEIAKSLGCKVVCHPPIKDELRAYHKSDEIREPLSYFARNRNIVDETEMLFVVPFQNERQTHGGTWYTFDYSVKKDKSWYIIFPGDN